MRHYFWIETETELTIETRMDIYSSMMSKVDGKSDIVVKSSGCKTNLPPGLAVLVTVGDLL